MVLNTYERMSLNIMKGSIKKWCMTVRQMHIRRIVRWTKNQRLLASESSYLKL